jgi:hypothetical protein
VWDVRGGIRPRIIPMSLSAKFPMKFHLKSFNQVSFKVVKITFHLERPLWGCPDIMSLLILFTMILQSITSFWVYLQVQQYQKYHHLWTLPVKLHLFNFNYNFCIILQKGNLNRSHKICDKLSIKYENISQSTMTSHSRKPEFGACNFNFFWDRPYSNLLC